LGPDAFVITLSPSLAEPFLTFSDRRDLRETVWRARTGRGANAGTHDNRPVIAQIMALRQEQAALHGYKTYADYELVDRMAGKTASVLELLQQAWEPAKAHAEVDRQALTAMAHTLGNPRLSPLGTGATWRKRCAPSALTWMMPNSSPISRWTR
jgi:peptidyl-dipeptidase Dcp